MCEGNYSYKRAAVADAGRAGASLFDGGDRRRPSLPLSNFSAFMASGDPPFLAVWPATAVGERPACVSTKGALSGAGAAMRGILTWLRQIRLMLHGIDSVNLREVFFTVRPSRAKHQRRKSW